MPITNAIVSSKFLCCPFLDGDVHRAPSYGIYFSQFIPYAKVCSNAKIRKDKRSQFLTVKLLKQGCRYHKFRNAFFLILTVTWS